MCKVFMIAGIKKEHQETVKRIVEVASKEMSTTDADGVGYAAITNKGKIYGEKWLNKEDAFKIHEQPKPEYSTLFLESLLDEAIEFENNEVTTEPVYAKFGTMNKKNIDDTVAIILHTRRATVGTKTIENVHPFYETETKLHPDTALIHNGAIKNHHLLTKKASTCDSETILHEYLKEMVCYNPWSINKVAETLKGEYTVAVLSSSYNKTTLIPYMDIFKSKKELVVGYCPEIETAIFCTSKYTLDEIAKISKVTIEKVSKVKDGFLIRLDAITGKRIDDPVSFKLSDNNVSFPYSGEGSGGHTDLRNRRHGPQIRSEAEVISLGDNAAGVSQDDIEETIDDVKEKFEMNHTELFRSQYHMPEGLTENEAQFLALLNQNNTTNFRALRLVEETLGVKISS